MSEYLVVLIAAARLVAAPASADVRDDVWFSICVWDGYIPGQWLSSSTWYHGNSVRSFTAVRDEFCWFFMFRNLRSFNVPPDDAIQHGVAFLSCSVQMLLKGALVKYKHKKHKFLTTLNNNKSSIECHFDWLKFAILRYNLPSPSGHLRECAEAFPALLTSGSCLQEPAFSPWGEAEDVHWTRRGAYRRWMTVVRCVLRSSYLSYAPGNVTRRCLYLKGGNLKSISECSCHQHFGKRQINFNQTRQNTGPSLMKYTSYFIFFKFLE